MTTPSDGIEVDIDDLVGIVAFVETSAFVAASVLDDIHHADVVRVLDAAVRSGCRLITTYAVILELIWAVRKKVTMSHRRQSGSEEEQAGVDASAEDAVARTFEIIDDVVDQGILKIVAVKKPHGYSGLCRKARVHSGHAVYVADNRAYRHKGIGPFDLIHYASAEDAGASVIITSDAAFADIEGGGDEFGHIRVQLAGGPPIDLLGMDGGQDEGRWGGAGALGRRRGAGAAPLLIPADIPLQDGHKRPAVPECDRQVARAGMKSDTHQACAGRAVGIPRRPRQRRRANR